MPYSKASDLPDSVQHVLPEHAKAIYMKAFNSALEIICGNMPFAAL